MQTARSHLALMKALEKSLEERTKIKVEASEKWTPDEDWRRDAQMVSTTIVNVGQTLAKALEAEKKVNSGLTEEQLKLQFRAELIEAAQTMSDDDWAEMVMARAKRAP